MSAFCNLSSGTRSNRCLRLALVASAALLIIGTSLASAKPYYYYFGDSATQQQEQEQATPKSNDGLLDSAAQLTGSGGSVRSNGGSTGDKQPDATFQIGESAARNVKAPNEQVAAALNEQMAQIKQMDEQNQQKQLMQHLQQQSEPVLQQQLQQQQQQLPAVAPGETGNVGSRMKGHLSELYTHGSSAVRNLAETVHPDIKNIGKDITDVYKTTATDLGKRIEPFTHTVRPYLDQAQKVVGPFVNHAREEVPKLIHQAGPALSKVHERLTDAWGRLYTTGSGMGHQVADATSSLTNGQTSELGGADASSQAAASAEKVQQQIQEAAEKAKQSVTSSVPVDSVHQTVDTAATPAASS